MVAYIVTRDRPGNLKRIIPRWLEQDIPVTLVVEGSESEQHKSLVRGMGWGRMVSVISPVQRNRGIGHARRFAVAQASRVHRSIIMSDDDVMPNRNSSMRTLLREAESPYVLGIGATRTLHDRFSGGVTASRDDVILCPGGWGMQLFALNIENTIKIGNFDSRLDCFGEDHELMRNGIATGIPWLVHCGAKCDALGVRYDPGGLNSFIGSGDRAKREIECRKVIHKRWPAYVSMPEARPRMRWQKMLDDYIPGWRTRSAMHGGEWELK